MEGHFGKRAMKNWRMDNNFKEEEQHLKSLAAISIHPQSKAQFLSEASTSCKFFCFKLFNLVHEKCFQ